MTQKERSRKWYLANREKAIARAKEWRLAHPERYRELTREGSRRWAKKNPEYGRLASRLFYQRHRDDICAKRRGRRSSPEAIAKAVARNRKHPEAVRAGVIRRRARLRNAPISDLSTWAVKYLPSIFRNRCVYCGQLTKLEIDHVTAISRGGSNTLGNVVVACRSCNAHKSNGEPPPFWWTCRR